MSQFFLEEILEPALVLSDVGSLLVDDKAGVAEDPMAHRLIKTLEGLGVGHPYQNFFSVSQGQLLDPAGEV